MIQKQILNLQDLADLTGLSKSHLYKLTHKRAIPYYKPSGKVIFFNYDEIKKWLFSNRVDSIEEIEHKASSFMLKSIIK